MVLKVVLPYADVFISFKKLLSSLDPLQHSIFIITLQWMHLLRVQYSIGSSIYIPSRVYLFSQFFKFLISDLLAWSLRWLFKNVSM